MPNESLISALQGLRDDYTQKQKATNNLLTALKGKSSAFGKLQQTLNDYATKNPSADASLGKVQQAFGATQDSVNPLLPTLARDTKTLISINGALKAAITALSSDPVDVVQLSRPVETLQSLAAEEGRLAEVMPEVTQVLDQAQQELGAVFGAALRDAMAAQGIEVTGTSPKFEVGRFEIGANFLKRSASINYGKEVVVKRVPLSVAAIMKAYQSAVKSISGRSENPDAWIAQFYSAWETARKKRDAAEKRANIVDCYFEMVILRQPKLFYSVPTKNGFAEYSRAQFAYDLFEIAVRPQRKHQGLAVFAHAATRSQTDNIAKNMWIVEGRGPHDGRYIGDIVFDTNN